MKEHRVQGRLKFLYDIGCVLRKYLQVGCTNHCIFEMELTRTLEPIARGCGSGGPGDTSFPPILTPCRVPQSVQP